MKKILLYGEAALHGNYAAAIRAAGGEVVWPRDPPALWDCGGLLLPGGGDIHGCLPPREAQVIARFVEWGRPVLGICRGMQAINVWFGGTLYRHIPGHQLPRGDMVHGSRAVGLAAQLLGPTPQVNSNHHQAVEVLGGELEAVQWAQDGTVEALVHRSLPVWGVQWHPERQSFRLRRSDAVDAAPVFRHFLARAEESQEKSGMEEKILLDKGGESMLSLQS